MKFKDKIKYVQARSQAAKIAENLHACYWPAERDESAEEHLATEAHDALLDLAAIYGYDLVPLSAQEDAA